MVGFRDRHTKFFHTCTLRRKKQNKITALKNDLGDWIMDKDQLKTEAVNFYNTLYGEHPSPMRGLPPNSFPRLNDEYFNLLNRPVSDEEIKDAFFDMTPLKATRSDGFHALLYQSQWDYVGASVCRWVKGVFDGKSIDSELNNSFIVLIPKI